MKTKVVLAKCSGYVSAEVASALDRVMSELGGMHRFIAGGRTVLIKPNMLTGSSPDRAVTTHPEVVRALIRLVRRFGATPVVADSAASAIKMRDVWEKTGYAELCADEGVELINLEHSGAVGFDIEGMKFSVAKPVLEAGLVINTPKLKTHSLTILTNAVKNIYGVMPGYQKTMLHKLYPHPSAFGDFLSVLYSVVKPGLTICDAIVGMDGNGPAAGEPVRLGFLAGSADAVSLDAAICDILGIDARKVLYFKGLKRLEAGETDLAKIELTGDTPESLALPRFRLPNTIVNRIIPDWLPAIIRPFIWIRPSFSDKCAACALCVKACPVFALSLEDGGARPRLNGAKCIECCCCHEICPEKAVEMEHSRLVRMFLRNRFP